MSENDFPKGINELLEWSKKLGNYSLAELAVNPIPPLGFKPLDHLADTLHLHVLNAKKSEKKLHIFSELSRKSKKIGFSRLEPEYCLKLIANELRVSEAAILLSKVNNNSHYIPSEPCFIEYLNDPTPIDWLDKALDDNNGLALLNSINSKNLSFDQSKGANEEKNGSHFLFARIGLFDEIFMFHRSLGSPEFSSFDEELVQGLSQNIRLVQENDKLYIDMLKASMDLDKANTELVELNIDLENKVEERTRDINEAKFRAQKLQEQAEASNRSKSIFLATMSHELRTPLNGILGMAQLLETTKPSKEQNKYIKTIDNAGQILLTLINDILDYAKIESGQMSIDEHLFSLPDTTLEIYHLFYNMAEEKNVEFSISIAPHAQDFILGDQVRLRQILINLCNNAIKFTKEGSVKVNIEVRPATESSTESLCFYVKDTGIGVSDEKINQLFKPFVQAEISTTREFGGTGLGLAISKRLVKAMKGEIGVDSESGQGSTFWFSLPYKLPSNKLVEEYKQQQRFEEKEKSAEIANTKTIKSELTETNILVVEDNVVNQMTIEALLEKEGLKCTIVDTGEGAISAFVTHPWDLVFMDYQLPDMTGVDVTKKLREFEDESKCSSTPIVAITANAMESDRKMCLDAGMDFFIAKPIQRKNLQQALEMIKGH